MSSLIWFTNDENALIVTDTLAMTKEGDGDWHPYLFCSKALYLPHLRLVMAGTGRGGFLDQWFLLVNTRMLVRGVEHLAEHAQAALQKLLAKAEAHPDHLPGKTSTVYHFGVSEVTGKIVTYAFRSANGFRPECLPHGFACKPPVATGEHAGDIVEAFKQTLARQLDEMPCLPVDERVCIGGQAYVIQLTPDACVHNKLMDFDDFELQTAQAYARFERG